MSDALELIGWGALFVAIVVAGTLAIRLVARYFERRMADRREKRGVRDELATYPIVPVYVHELPPFLRSRFPLRARISGSRVLA